MKIEPPKPKARYCRHCFRLAHDGDCDLVLPFPGWRGDTDNATPAVARAPWRPVADVPVRGGLL